MERGLSDPLEIQPVLVARFASPDHFPFPSPWYRYCKCSCGNPIAWFRLFFAISSLLGVRADIMGPKGPGALQQYGEGVATRGEQGQIFTRGRQTQLPSALRVITFTGQET